MRTFTKDEVLEYLIRSKRDGPLKAMRAVVMREVQADDIASMDRTIQMIYEELIPHPPAPSGTGTVPRQQHGRSKTDA
jgi:hypothetical protein